MQRGGFLVTDSGRDRLRRTAQDWVAGLEQGRRTGLVVAVTRRCVEIDGLTYGGLMSIELFTTVLPLVLLGFSYVSDFAGHAAWATRSSGEGSADGSAEA